MDHEYNMSCKLKMFLNDPTKYIYSVDDLVDILEYTNYEHLKVNEAICSMCSIDVADIVENGHSEHSRYMLLRIAYIDGVTGTGNVTEYLKHSVNTKFFSFDTKLQLVCDALKREAEISDDESGLPLLNDIADSQIDDLYPIMSLIALKLNDINPDNLVGLMLMHAMLDAARNRNIKHSQSMNIISNVTERIYGAEAESILKCATLTGSLGNLSFWKNQYKMKFAQMDSCELPTL